MTDAGDRDGEQLRVADGLGARKTFTGVPEGALGVAEEPANDRQQAQEPCGALVVRPGVLDGLLHQCRARRKRACAQLRQRVEDISTVQPVRGIDEDGLVERGRPFEVTGEVMERSRGHATSPQRRSVVGGTKHGQVRQLRRGGRGAALGRVLRSFVELACHALVGALGAESEVTRAQLDVRARSSEPHVDLATLPGQGALVAEGCEQRMDESHLGTVDLDDPCTRGSL